MTTMITAHSGCDDTPDNSLQYLSHAITCGADAFEVDVRRSSDGMLYLSHDADGSPCVPLADAFAMMQGLRIRINCDLKEENLEKPVLALAGSCGVLDRLILTGTVSAEVLLDDSVRSRTCWNIPIPHRAEREQPGVVSAWVRSTVALCRAHGVRVINVKCDICSDPVLDALGKEGIAVSAWTVNDPAVAERLLRHSVYNITSRAPGVLLRLREQL